MKKMSYFLLGIVGLVLVLVTLKTHTHPLRMESFGQYNDSATGLTAVSKDLVEFKMTNAFEVPRIEVAKAQIPTTVDVPVPKTSLGDILKNNWGALLFAFLALVEIVIRATPTIADNSIFNLIKKLIDAIVPNKTTTGGVHP